MRSLGFVNRWSGSKKEGAIDAIDHMAGRSPRNMMGDFTPQSHSGNHSDPSEGLAHADSALESLLNVRGQSIRSRSGMNERVISATLPLISPAYSFKLNAARQRRVRWGIGSAIAASLVAAFVIVQLPTNKNATSDVVASTDQGGTVAEPVLVSLLAGSEVISSDGTSEFVIDRASAMPILRTRDASFGDLNSEVQLILASASTQ